ncbi:MAG TPA: hypothetical protein DIT58_11695 [Porticoccaceae bacterium]|nr:hypothetical protein [Porticoccaceae bacterium]
MQLVAEMIRDKAPVRTRGGLLREYGCFQGKDQGIAIFHRYLQYETTGGAVHVLDQKGQNQGVLQLIVALL